MSVETNLAEVNARLDAACQKFDRPAASVNLLAVSKTKPFDMIQAAANAGQRHFAENYLQDALPKIEAASGMNLVWHFIGAIQSNKTRQIAANFDWVHTVSSLKVAKRLSAQRESPGALNVLIQVNINNEPTKSGVVASELLTLAEQIAQLEKLKLRGLMCIPQKTESFEAQRATFSACRSLMLDVQTALNCPHFDQLSMGMSGDFEIAIEEGATMVRIGSAVFGRR